MRFILALGTEKPNGRPNILRWRSCNVFVSSYLLYVNTCIYSLSILALFAHDCQQNWWRYCQRCDMVTVVDAIINGFLLINIILLTLPRHGNL